MTEVSTLPQLDTMSRSSEESGWTVDDLGALPQDGLRYELVDGCLVVRRSAAQQKYAGPRDVLLIDERVALRFAIDELRADPGS